MVPFIVSKVEQQKMKRLVQTFHNSAFKVVLFDDPVHRFNSHVRVDMKVFAETITLLLASFGIITFKVQ